MSDHQFTMPSSPAGIPGFTEWERSLAAETRAPTAVPATRAVAPPAVALPDRGVGHPVVAAVVAFVLGLVVGTGVILGTGLGVAPVGPGAGPAAPAPVATAPAAP